MDEPTLPHVDARMGDHAALGKQHQITRANVVAGDRAAPSIELGNGAGCRYLGVCSVHVANESAAIKAGVGGIAAIPVGCADQAYGVDRDIARLVGRQSARIVKFVRGALCAARIGHRATARLQQKGQAHDGKRERFVDSHGNPLSCLEALVQWTNVPLYKKMDAAQWSLPSYNLF